MAARTTGLTPVKLVGLLAGLLILVAAHLLLGSSWVTPGDVLSAIRGDEDAQLLRVIVIDLRLMRALTALVCGAALAVSGLQMQTLFRNPLAGPYVLGITSGAGLGVAIVLLSGWTGMVAGAAAFVAGLGLVAGAIIGAGLVMLLVLAAARRVASTMTLLILGLLIGYAVNALVQLLFHLSTAEQAQRYVAWGFGSFADVDGGDMLVLVPILLLALAAAGLLAKPMNAMLLGADYAGSLGVDVKRMRLALVALASILAATVVAYCGPIGFIGIAVPHLVRGWLHSSDHRHVLPGCVLLGAIVALAADLIAKLPGIPGALPLNAVTALIGAPVVAWVVLRNRHLRKDFQ